MCVHLAGSYISVHSAAGLNQYLCLMGQDYLLLSLHHIKILNREKKCMTLIPELNMYIPNKERVKPAFTIAVVPFAMSFIFLD